MAGASLSVTHQVTAMVGSEGWWLCTACGKRAMKASSLVCKACHGGLEVARTVHVSHNLLVPLDLAICSSCLVHVQHHGRPLKLKCRPATATGDRNLASVARGVHPQSGDLVVGVQASAGNRQLR